MFSATFDEEVQQMAAELLRPGHFIIRVGEVNRAVETVEQLFVAVWCLLRESLYLLRFRWKSTRRRSFWCGC